MYYNNSGIPRTTNSNKHDDPLKAQFTAWLNTMLIHAKYQFLQDRRKGMTIISLNEIPADLIEDPVNYFSHVENSRSDFDFEEERLAKAFSELTVMRREVLRLLFVEELSPDEVAERLHCSNTMVRQQKSRALKRLRKVLGVIEEDLNAEE